MATRIKGSRSDKKSYSKIDKIAIIKDWHHHECDVAFVVKKYKVSRPTFWRWRNELDTEAIKVEPSTHILVKLENQCAIRDTHDLEISNKKRIVVNYAADLLIERFEDKEKAKYFENKDLIAIIKLSDINPDANPQTQQDVLEEALKSFEKSRKAKMVENAQDVEEIKSE